MALFQRTKPGSDEFVDVQLFRRRLENSIYARRHKDERRFQKTLKLKLEIVPLIQMEE